MTGPTGADEPTGSGDDPGRPRGDGGMYGGPGARGGQYGGGQYGASPYGSPEYGSGQYGSGQYGGYPYGGTPYGDPYPSGSFQPFPADAQQGGTGPPGDLGVRFGARVIDSLIIWIPELIINLIIASAFGVSVTSAGGDFSVSISAGYRATSAIVTIIFAVIWVAYFVWFETEKGQTLGKKLLHLRVVGPAGGNPTRRESLRRNVYVVLGSIGIICGAVIPFGGIIEVLFAIAAIVLVIVIAVTINASPTKQGKHDEMAGGTMVVTAD